MSRTTQSVKTKGGAGRRLRSRRGKELKPCVRSSFTVASLDQALDVGVRLSISKTKLWLRVLAELGELRENEGFLGEGLSSEQIESFDALETAVQKAKTAAWAVGEAATRAHLELSSAVISLLEQGVSNFTRLGCLRKTRT